jgi:DNA-binding NarL/FixJ family response regulator
MGIKGAIVETASMTRNVLIVDDHAGFRASARRVLEAAGYSVIGEAPDGVSGVDAVLEHRPDLALIDVQLPDIDGFEVIRRLRDAGSRADTVLTSSRDGSDFASLIESSGARGFLPKAELSAASLEALL